MATGISLFLVVVLGGLLFVFSSALSGSGRWLMRRLDRIARGRKPAEWFLYILFILVPTVVTAFLFDGWSGSGPDDAKLSTRVTLIGIVLATMGWVLKSALDLSLQRQRHTLDVILKMVESSFLSGHFVNLLASFPRGRHLSAEEYAAVAEAESKAEGNPPIARSITSIANYYEYVAYAVRSGDMELRTLELTHRAPMVEFANKVAPYLAEARGRNSSNFEHYYWLLRMWDVQLHELATKDEALAAYERFRQSVNDRLTVLKSRVPAAPKP